MKLAKIIFGVIVAIIISLIFIYKPAHAPTDREPDTFVISNGSYCFARSQVASVDAPYSVTENIKIDISGNSVTGRKSGTQSGPDMTNGYEGTLTGTRAEDILRLVFAYTIEGSKNSEKEIYVLGEDTLTKKRYALKEEGGMLVPDMQGEPVDVVYTSKPCE